MSVEIIQERLASYGCKSALEEEQALREITQEIVLAGLGRTDLFGNAALQGGTCLRIFHSLSRFSEQRFVKLHELPSLELWTRDFFLAQCRKLGEAAPTGPR